MCPTSITPLSCTSPSFSLNSQMHTHTHTKPFNGLTSNNNLFLRWEISLNNSSLISPWTAYLWIKEHFKEPLIDAHTHRWAHVCTWKPLCMYTLARTHTLIVSSWQHCRQINRQFRKPENKTDIEGWGLVTIKVPVLQRDRLSIELSHNSLVQNTSTFSLSLWAEQKNWLLY